MTDSPLIEDKTEPTSMPVTACLLEDYRGIETAAGPKRCSRRSNTQRAKNETKNRQNGYKLSVVKVVTSDSHKDLRGCHYLDDGPFSRALKDNAKGCLDGEANFVELIIVDLQHGLLKKWVCRVHY